MSVDDGNSQGACSDIDCDEASDLSYESETPIDIPDNFIFDEADDDEYLHFSLQDIAEQLDAWAGPNVDGDFYDIRNDIITEEDRDNIRAFQLKMLANIPRHAYDRMCYAFQHKMSLDSEWVVVHRLALLSGIEPRNIHCCIKSCIAYTGQYVHDERCPFCNEARYTKHGRPRCTFMYIPLIP
ncbi:hypothetical protein F4604DRAFT_1730884 [Suillus subluteus]|nr:hypothetical protein F4604DRAFT_1730884 [Suillus subluteus]